MKAIKYGQLIAYSKTNNVFKDHAINETWRLVPDLFLSLEQF